MGQNLKFEYDKLSDTLHIEKCDPYLGQDEDEISDLVLGRWNPSTGDLESLAISPFMFTLKESGSFTLPIAALFKAEVEADV